MYGKAVTVDCSLAWLVLDVASKLLSFQSPMLKLDHPIIQHLFLTHLPPFVSLVPRRIARAHRRSRSRGWGGNTFSRSCSRVGGWFRNSHSRFFFPLMEIFNDGWRFEDEMWSVLQNFGCYYLQLEYNLTWRVQAIFFDFWHIVVFVCLSWRPEQVWQDCRLGQPLYHVPIVRLRYLNQAFLFKCAS